MALNAFQILSSLKNLWCLSGKSHDRLLLVDNCAPIIEETHGQAPSESIVERNRIEGSLFQH